MEHELKTDSAVFWETMADRKKFEIRKDDRAFAVGDTLVLRETRYSGAEMVEGKPLEYTGRVERKLVKHIIRGPIYGLSDGWVIMSHD